MGKRKGAIAIVGVSAFAVGIMLPFAGANATNSTTLTDTISVTIEDNCALSYANTAHTNGTTHGTWGNTDNTKNTLSVTLANSSVDTNIGSTNFSVICNDGGGSQVAISATDLTSEYSDTIEFSSNTPSADASSWGINNGTTWVEDDGYVWSSENSVAATSFSVTYGAGIDSTQSAGTYTGTVTYTLTHPYSEPADPTPTPTTYIMQEVATWGSTLTEGQQVQAKDSRDNKLYYVTKLKDGNIWMTQNLDFDIDSTKTYTSADTDISADWQPEVSTYSTDEADEWEYYTTTPQSYDPGNLCWKGTFNTDNDGALNSETETCTDSNMNYHIGNYYNWTAAVAMDDSSDYGEDETSVSQSICPAGWTLPIGGYGEEGNGSFYYLLNEYGFTSNIESGSSEFYASPLNFVPGGVWNGDSGLVASQGNYWSSAVLDSSYAYTLYFNSEGYVNLNNAEERSLGYSVRCVANE